MDFDDGKKNDQDNRKRKDQSLREWERINRRVSYFFLPPFSRKQ